MPVFFAVTLKKKCSLLELLHDEAGKCDPIRKMVLLIQQLLYKESWRHLVLCQTDATGSFLYNAMCSWNKFKRLLVWRHLMMWGTSFTFTMHHSNRTGLITGHRSFSWDCSFEDDGCHDLPAASISLFPSPGPWPFVCTVTDVLLAQGVFPETWSLFAESPFIW